MSNHLIVTVHGIRTYGQWQPRLETLIKEIEPTTTVFNYTYGYFSILGFIFPPLRWLVTSRFQKRMLNLVRSSHWDRIDLVGHSFGTHLISWSLYNVPAKDRPRIHTIILAGSVLKSTFRWDKLLGKYVSRLVNECGTKDNVLVLSQLVVLFTGMAGRIGFQGMTGENFKNRFYKFQHSDYFVKDGKLDDDFMRYRWVPLLTEDRPMPLIDERQYPTGLAGVLDGIILFTLNNAEPIKLTIYIVPFLATIWWINGLYQSASTRALTAIAAMELQTPYMRERGILLALEAAKKNMTVDLRHTIWKGIAQLPIYVQILPVEFSTKYGAASGSFAFDQNENYLATDNGHALIQLWDLENGSEIAQLKHEYEEKIEYSYSDRNMMHLAPKAECLIYGTDPTVIYYPLDKGQEKILLGAGTQGERVLVSTNGEVIAIYKRGSIEIWSSCKRQLNTTIRINDDIRKIELSWNGKYLAGSNGRGELMVWNTDSGLSIGRYTHDRLKNIDLIRFDMSGTKVSVLDDKLVYVFSISRKLDWLHDDVIDLNNTGIISDYRLPIYSFGVNYIQRHDTCELRNSLIDGGDFGSGSQLDVCYISPDGEYGGSNPDNEIYIQRFHSSDNWPPLIIPNVSEDYSSDIRSHFGIWGPSSYRFGVAKRQDQLLVLQLPYIDMSKRVISQYHDIRNQLYHESNYTLQQLFDQYSFILKDEGSTVKSLDSNWYFIQPDIQIGTSENGRYVSVPIGINTISIHDTVAKRGIGIIQIKEFYRPAGYTIPVMRSSISNNGQYIAVSRSDTEIVVIVKSSTNELVARVTPSMLGLKQWWSVDFGFSAESDVFLLEVENSLFILPLNTDGMLKEGCRRVEQNLTREDWKHFVGDLFYKKTCPDLPIGISPDEAEAATSLKRT